MSGTARVRHMAEFMRSMYPAFSRRATQVCVMSAALEKIALGAPDASAVAFDALKQASPFGWNERHCKVPPPGWWCSREPGHEGPCAARPTGNRAACEVERDAVKCWRQPCADTGQCTAPAVDVKGA